MTIYIGCPKPETPSGGVYFLYQVTRLLRELGHDALLVQESPFDPYWFESYPELNLATDKPQSAGEGDMVLIPEVRWPQPPRIDIRHGARKVLFVQNYIWLSQALYMQDPGETLVCSRFLANWMQRELKANVVGKITPFLEDMWHPTPKQANRTLVFARRNVYHDRMKRALEAAGFPVEYVTKPLTQSEISQLLDDCEFYIHLTHPEGFPMACLEAMRSGVIVVGTTGGGGNEFLFDRETAVVVQDPESGHYGSADVFVARIMEQMEILRDNADIRSRIWNAAFQWSLQYTAENTKKELKEIFG